MANSNLDMPHDFAELVKFVEDRYIGSHLAPDDQLETVNTVWETGEPESQIDEIGTPQQMSERLEVVAVALDEALPGRRFQRVRERVLQGMARTIGWELAREFQRNEEALATLDEARESVRQRFGEKLTKMGMPIDAKLLDVNASNFVTLYREVGSEVPAGKIEGAYEKITAAERNKDALMAAWCAAMQSYRSVFGDPERAAPFGKTEMQKRTERAAAIMKQFLAKNSAQA